MEIRQVFPIFEEGRILKKDSLDMLRDYAPEFFSLLLESYGSGVVAGFNIREWEKGIAVGPGILKSGASFLTMKEEALLEYTMYGQTVRIVIEKSGSRISPDYRTDAYSLSLKQAGAFLEGEYELGRFCLEKGARLRTYGEYKDFYDLSTEFNTLNLLHVRYACGDGSTLMPLILKLYGKGILNSSKAEPLDLSFALTCLGNSRIPGELIRAYLEARGEGVAMEGNMELYQSLLRLYSRLVAGAVINRRTRGISGKTMID